MKAVVNKIIQADKKGNLNLLLNPLKSIYSFCLKLKLKIFVIIEKNRGLDFTERVSLEDLGLSADTSKSYVASSPRRVKYVLNSLKIKKTDSIIDFGSGKGKMLYEMSKFPFEKVDGVEISKKLCEIANNNTKQLKIIKSTIYNSNAAEFKKLDSYNFFYFFNPFPANIMESVMRNIQESYENNPRNITIIYYVPLYKEEITKSGLFKKVDAYWDLFIYKNYDTKD